MGRRSTASAEESRFALLATRLKQARPNHVWTPSATTFGSATPGCAKCPWGSPFRLDRRSHLYIIEEEPV